MAGLYIHIPFCKDLLKKDHSNKTDAASPAQE